jgi:hypothetical protein
MVAIRKKRSMISDGAFAAYGTVTIRRQVLQFIDRLRVEERASLAVSAV